MIAASIRICLRAFATASALFVAALVGGCAWLSPSVAEAQQSPSDPYEVHFFKAQMAVDKADYEAALGTLEPLCKRPGTPPEVLTLLAQTYLEQRNFDQSLETLDRTIKEYPQYVPAWELRASVHRRRGDRDAAVADLEAALALLPRNPRLIESLASLRLRSLETWELGSEGSEMRRTIDLYERLVESRSGSERITPLIILASIYSRMGDHAKAVDYATQATAIRSHDLRAQLTLATIYEEANRLEDALEAYRQALLIDPANSVTQTKIDELVSATKYEGGTAAFYSELATEFPGVREIQELYANELIKSERWGEAVSHYEALIARYGDSRQLKAGLVRALLAAGREEEALKMLSELVADEETDTQVILDLAEALRTRGDLDLVIDLLNKVRNSGNADVRVALTLAQVQIQAGREKDAVATLETIVKESPSLFPVVALLSDLYAEEGRYEEARNLLAGVDEVTRSRRGSEIQLREANLYRMEGRPDEAARILEQVMEETEPPAEVALRLLVDIYDELKQPEKAFAAVDRYIAGTTGDANRDARGIKAWLYWRNGEHVDAIELLEELHAEDSGDFGTVQLLVENYAEIGEFEKAEGLMRAAGAQSAELDADYLILRARLFHLQNRHAEAAETAEKLLAREQDNDDYLMIAGEYYYEAGRMEDAERVLRRVIELDPQNAEAYNALGYFLAEAGVKLDDALALVTKALELNPDAGHIVDSLGWVHYMQGRYEDAVRELERAVELLKDSPDAVIYEHLGDAYMKVGRTEDARAAYEKSLELKPGSDKVKDKLE